MTVFLRIGSALIVGTSVFGGQVAMAQSCSGLPSLAKAAKVISTTATGSGSDRLVVGRLGMNGQRIFAGVHGGYGSREDFLKPRDLVLGIDVGYSFQLGGTRGFELCPVVQSKYQRGPTFSGQREEHITTSIGLALGRTWRASPSFAAAPFVQAGLIQRHTSFGTPNVLDPSANRISRSYDKLLASTTIGVGFDLGRILTLTPVMVVPYGAGPQSPFGTGYLWGREPSFSISASLRSPR